MHILNLFLLASTASQGSITGCDSYCGSDNQYCCSKGELCATNSNNVAVCMPSTLQPPNDACAATCGIWQAVTKTEIKTVYMTYSTFIPTGPCLPEPTRPIRPTTITTTTTTTPARSCDSGMVVCGPICCQTGQYCFMDGLCAVVTTPVPTTTVPFHPPVRPTEKAGQWRLGVQH
jgi:hypothetical protein